jgi:hypothetical protein
VIKHFLADLAQGFALASALGLVLYACDARAQPNADDETTLALAMAFVAEAGWDAATDHAAIAHVLARKAERHRMPLLDVLVRYVASQHVTDTRRPWLYELRLDATKPAHWPHSLAWSAHVGRWLACVERAREFLRGDLADPCHAEHFGGVMDTPRGRMQIAACSGVTRNTFYTVRTR